MDILHIPNELSRKRKNSSIVSLKSKMHKFQSCIKLTRSTKSSHRQNKKLPTESKDRNPHTNMHYDNLPSSITYNRKSENTYCSEIDAAKSSPTVTLLKQDSNITADMENRFIPQHSPPAPPSSHDKNVKEIGGKRSISSGLLLRNPKKSTMDLGSLKEGVLEIGSTIRSKILHASVADDYESPDVNSLSEQILIPNQDLPKFVMSSFTRTEYRSTDPKRQKMLHNEPYNPFLRTVYASTDPETPLKSDEATFVPPSSDPDTTKESSDCNNSGKQLEESHSSSFQEDYPQDYTSDFINSDCLRGALLYFLKNDQSTIS